jgi:hypothetical protein
MCQFTNWAHAVVTVLGTRLRGSLWFGTQLREVVDVGRTGRLAGR